MKTLCELVAIPSVNPMGMPRSGPEFYEHRVTDYLETLFTRIGLPWERQAVRPSSLCCDEPVRENIIARLDGHVPVEQGGRLLLFEAHQDTVPVEGMTIEPWNPVIRDDRIYGRGSCDIKGGMAAMLVALSRLAEERPKGMPTILMACTINEEHGFTGATALAKLWDSADEKHCGPDGGPDSIIPRQPDAAVVAEPTMLDVVTAHNGVVRWKCRAHGRAVHSSQPELGENAIYKMAPTLLALARYQKEVAPTLAEHPLCGRPNLSVGTITGGVSVNTVPGECVIHIDRRLLPKEDPIGAYRHIIDYLKADPGAARTEHDEPLMICPGLSDDHNGPLADRILAAAARVVGPRGKIGVPYGTDASTYQQAGVPTIVFGPGSIDQAHTVDEYLEIDQLTSAAEIYYQIAIG